MAELHHAGKPSVAIITVGRSDFSILRPLARLFIESDRFDAGLWVGGAHFDPAGGHTIRDIEQSGLTIWGRVDTPVQARNESGMVQTMADQMSGFNRLLAERRPDLAIILGDRYEAMAAGLACLSHLVPICHLSGGSVTEGAIDDVFRNCLSQMADLHFCDTAAFAERIAAMRGKPDGIFPYGALGLDGIRARVAHDFNALEARFGLEKLGGPGYCLVALHPETRNPEANRRLIDSTFAALEQSGLGCLFTYPNADPGSEDIISAIEESCARHGNHLAVRNFGFEWFYSAMDHASMLLGNSSSGIIEAASLHKPVINIGDRQKGRYCGENVLHCEAESGAILTAMDKARSPEMAELMRDFVNPYGDGLSASRIFAEVENYFRNR